MATIHKVLDSLNMTLEAIREIDATMPIQVAHVLTMIARHPGISMQKLADYAGLTQSSTSRNVAALSKWHRLGKPGYDLVEAIEDPEDRRAKVLFLTQKGRERMAKILRAADRDVDVSEVLEATSTAREYERNVRARARGAR